MKQDRTWSTKQLTVLALQIIIACIVLLGKWIGFHYVLGESTVSLLQIGSALRKIEEIMSNHQADLSGYLPAAAVIYYVLAGCLWVYWTSIKITLHANEENGQIDGIGFTATIVLFAVLFLTVLLLNRRFGDGLDGVLMEDVIQLEPAAYVALVLSAAGVMVCREMPDRKLAPQSKEN